MPAYALLGIPAFYLLSIAPHAYAISIASSATPKSSNTKDPAAWSNANPRSSSTISLLQKQLSPTLFARYERAEAAHKNSIENLPLFIAVVLASVLAEKNGGLTKGIGGDVDVGTTTYLVGWFAARIAYTLLYINTEKESSSHARSMIWTAATFWSFWQIWSAAAALA